VRRLAFFPFPSIVCFPQSVFVTILPGPSFLALRPPRPHVLPFVREVWDYASEYRPIPFLKYFISPWGISGSFLTPRSFPLSLYPFPSSPPFPTLFFPPPLRDIEVIVYKCVTIVAAPCSGIRVSLIAASFASRDRCTLLRSIPLVMDFFLRNFSPRAGR